MGRPQIFPLQDSLKTEGLGSMPPGRLGLMLKPLEQDSKKKRKYLPLAPAQGCWYGDFRCCDRDHPDPFGYGCAKNRAPIAMKYFNKLGGLRHARHRLSLFLQVKLLASGAVV